MIPRIPLILLVTAAIASTGCRDEEVGALRIIHHSASESVPHSEIHSIALTSPDRACVVDSFENKVVCGNREWESPLVLGRQGSGPGEFRSPVHLLGGPSGRLGVVDLALARLSIFSADGELLSTVPLPPVFRPIERWVGHEIVGLYETYSDTMRSAPLAWVPLTANGALRTRTLSHVSELTTSRPSAFASGARSAEAGYVFFMSGYSLARYDANGRFVEEFTSPAYRPELPNERDVDEQAYAMRVISGRQPAAAELREFSRRPKPPVIRGQPLRFDDRGFLWVATTRDHDEFSYFDVFSGSDLVSSVRVRDRVLGYDILGTVLAVLVERRFPGEDGIRARAVDWYSIVD